MGVKSCSRIRCESIMCDTYVPTIGYVCNECQKEFEAYISLKGDEKLTEGEIKSELVSFMNTYKNTYDVNKMSINEFFNRYT